MQQMLWSGCWIFGTTFQTIEGGRSCGLRCSNSWQQSTHSRGNAYICCSCSVEAVHSKCGLPPTTSRYQTPMRQSISYFNALHMNTRRIDVFDMVNEKIRLLGSRNKVSRAAFYRLWREEFTHVKLPPYSRFSKCHICWEYRNCIESITNESVKETV